MHVKVDSFGSATNPIGHSYDVPLIFKKYQGSKIFHIFFFNTIMKHPVLNTYATPTGTTFYALPLVPLLSKHTRGKKPSTKTQYTFYHICNYPISAAIRLCGAVISANGDVYT